MGLVARCDHQLESCLGQNSYFSCFDNPDCTENAQAYFPLSLRKFKRLCETPY